MLPRLPFLCVFLMGGLLLAALPVSAEVTVVVPAAKQGDAGLALAVEDLRQALGGAKLLVRSAEASLPDADAVLLEPAQAGELAAEAYRIRPASSANHRAVTVTGDERGLIYGTCKLAERVRLGADPMTVSLDLRPAFPLRMFSEQGQLLDLPDRNYYAEEPPYVNEAMLRREVDEAKRLIDAVAKLGYNAIAFLHVSFEDYIDYEDLEGPIYPADDRHRLRSPVFCRYLSELCDYAHARHLEFYLQTYEIQYPEEVDRRYGVRMDSPNLPKIIAARCGELFRRVPLDGLVITPNETHPRCGYRSQQLWQSQGRPGAGRMCQLYDEACRGLGKRAIFRLWRVAATAAEAQEAIGQVPAEAMLETKDTGYDFFLNCPMTDILTSRLMREHAWMVTFDTFRQYDGWARCFCFVQDWGPRVQACRDGGVQALNAWGAWSPACINPDSEPDYLRLPDGSRTPDGFVQGWAGYWNAYRMFTRGFTPGQASAYLLARLAWEPDLPVAEIAGDFASIHLGAANAQAAAEALLQTQQAWQEHYLGRSMTEIAHPCYLKWSMIFAPKPAELEKAYQRVPLETLLASNRRALECLAAMERAFAKTDRAQASNAEVYDRFAEGIDKTALYLRTLHNYREYWWRQRADRDLEGDARTENAAALATVRHELQQLLDDWRRYPEEAALWRITYRHAGEPAVYREKAFSFWWPRGEDVTLEAQLSAK